MSMNKKILAVAVVGCLFAGAASATVNLSTGAGGPVKYSQELAINPAGTTLANTTQLDITTPFNYAFSSGEVRYVRVECSNGVKFAANTAVTGPATGTVGAVNGLGSSVITFSVTSNAAPGTIQAADTFTVTGDRIAVSTADASCSYSLYDTPSQAQAGGASGRITSATANYLDFLASYQMTVTAGAGGTANVEATPAYSQFVGGGNANLGSITTALTNAAIYQPDGTVLLFPEIIGAASKHIITGEFTAVANGDGTYTGAALNRVWVDTDASGCTVATPGDIFASTMNATTATFATGSTPLTNAGVCYSPQGSQAMQVSDFSVVWDVVTANAALYPNTPDIGPQALGSISRNGTEIQAPLVQTPSGYISRIALSNTGAVARPYTIKVIGETGNTITTNSANMAGTIPANGTTVIDMSSVLTSFTGFTRATVIVNVSAPTNSIQGLYQIVKPDTGAISNHVMVRPGTN